MPRIGLVPETGEGVRPAMPVQNADTAGQVEEQVAVCGVNGKGCRVLTNF